MCQYRVLIAAYPFCESQEAIFELFEQKSMTVVRNPHGHKLNTAEVTDLLTDIDAVIAGVEDVYSRQVIESAQQLKAICRIGSGYDGIDLTACRDKNVIVTYTPDANVQSVTELTIANMINLSRHITQSDRLLHGKTWQKTVGRLLTEQTIGIIGLGRIGKRVAQLLQPFGPTIHAHDIVPDHAYAEQHGIRFCDKQEILQQSDLITLHISYRPDNYHYIDRKTISRMKKGVLLLNTSRGSVIDEAAIIDALEERHIAAAALDVFEQEPYSGALTGLDNCILTPHIGGFAKRSLHSARVAACEECIRILSGEKTLNQVPVIDPEV